MPSIDDKEHLRILVGDEFEFISGPYQGLRCPVVRVIGDDPSDLRGYQVELRYPDGNLHTHKVFFIGGNGLRLYSFDLIGDPADMQILSACVGSATYPPDVCARVKMKFTVAGERSYRALFRNHGLDFYPDFTYQEFLARLSVVKSNWQQALNRQLREDTQNDALPKAHRRYAEGLQTGNASDRADAVRDFRPSTWLTRSLRRLGRWLSRANR